MHAGGFITYLVRDSGVSHTTLSSQPTARRLGRRAAAHTEHKHTRRKPTASRPTLPHNGALTCLVPLVQYVRVRPAVGMAGLKNHSMASAGSHSTRKIGFV